MQFSISYKEKNTLEISKILNLFLKIQDKYFNNLHIYNKRVYISFSNEIRIHFELSFYSHHYVASSPQVKSSPC